MRSFKGCASLILLLLISCNSNFRSDLQESTTQSQVADSSTPTPSPSIQSASPIAADGIVNFDRIDSALVSQEDEFDIQFNTESSISCSHVMQYPQVSGLADATLQTALNQSLRQNMIEQMGIIGDLLEGNRCPRESIRNSQDPFRLFTSTVYCETHFAESRLVSISCLTLTEPGAYPNPEVHTVTFDLKTGKIYQFADLFKPNSNYAVRMAVLMRDAWWESEGYISFPFQQLETGADFNFYFQDECDQNFQHHWEDKENFSLDLSGDPPEVCMVIPNLGGGASRNYLMPVRMGALEEILNTDGALSVLAERIDNRWQPY